MKNNGRKNFLISILFGPKVFAFLGLIVAVLISFPIFKNISQRHVINKEISDLQEEIGRIENKNTELTKLINYLNSGQYAEEQARLNFGLKKEGEQAVVIDIAGLGIKSADPEKDNLTNTVFNIPGLDKPEKTKSVNNPRRWVKYFLNNL